MILRQIPNALTIARLGLIIPFLLFLYQRAFVDAFYLFILAGVTDGLDGLLARHFHWQTHFGSLLDPVADKLLIACSFISLALLGQLPWWLVLLVFLRDITISIGVLAWFWLIKQTLSFRPTFLSKFNTVLQLALVTLCLIQLAYFSIPAAVTNALITLTAVTTLSTYVDYVWTWGKKAYRLSHPPK